MNKDVIDGLNPAQLGIYFDHLLQPGNCRYNIGLCCKISGVVDRHKLQESFKKVIKSVALHSESSGTASVDELDHSPLLFSGGIIENINLLSECRSEATSLAESIMHTAMKTEIPLTHAFEQQKSILFNICSDESLWFVQVHHIVSDRSGLINLIRETAKYYSSEEILEEVDKNRLSLASKISGEVKSKYWKNELRDLPVDSFRLSGSAMHSDTKTHSAKVTLSEQMVRNLLTTGAPLQQLVRTMLAIYCWRIGEDNTVILGDTFHGRTKDILTTPLGMHSKILPLRLEFSSDITVKGVLSQLNRKIKSAYRHRYYSAREMAQDAGILNGRDNNLSQVTFNYIDLSSPFNFGDASAILTANINPSERGPVQLRLYKLKNSFELILYCQSSHVDEKETQILLQRLVSLLEQVASSDLTIKARELVLITENEKHMQINVWNKPYEEYVNTDCIHELFQRQVNLSPDAIAIEYENETLSYRQLDQDVEQLASYLQSLGVAREQLVGLCADRSPQTIICILGILKSGAAYLPLDASHPKDRIEHILKDAKPALILGRETIFKILPVTDIECVSIEFIRASTHIGQEKDTPTSGDKNKATPENLAYVIYTSGSTGTPKGTLLQHRGLCNLTQALITKLGLCVGKRTLQFGSFNFDVSVWEVFSALCSGATLCITSKNKLAAGPSLQNTLHQLRIDTAILPPVVLPQLLAEGLPLLTTLAVGGEACSRELVETWSRGRCFINAYGPTEATVCSTIFNCLSDVTIKPPIGQPLPNTRAYVLDNFLNLLPIGVAGELYIAGIGLARGYLNQPGLTSEFFIPDPFSHIPGARLYKSGDLVRYMSDGNIDYLGRLDQQVKIRGYRIELGEIEYALTSLAGIKDAIVAVEETKGDKRLVAYIVAVDKRPSDELRVLLLKKLPDYMLPSAFTWMNAFPLTPSGKIDRRALSTIPFDKPNINYVAPRNEQETRLAEIWAEVLKIERVGIHDNFFDLGGHSLMATRIASKVRAIMHIDMPIGMLFDIPTIELLSQSLAQASITSKPGIYSEIKPVHRSGSLPLSFAQQRLWFIDQLEESSAFYNTLLTLRLKGSLNLESLHYALNQLIQRHESLRTIFVNEDGKPEQIILDSLALTISLVELGDAPSADQEGSCRRILLEKSKTPFDLTGGPLLEATLLKFSSSEWIFCLSMHHIISDGWSIGIMEREISVFYREHLEGKPQELSPLLIQYADFAFWQRRDETLQAQAAQITYWKQHLEGAPAQISLPFDKPRPPMQTYNGAKLARKIRAKTLSTIQALADRNNASLFMTVNAVFNLLLSRYTGQADISLGTPVANRNRIELEPLIGVFVNTLVLRTQIDSNNTFDELLRQVRDTTLLAYDNQDVPFDKLVDLLNVERITSSTPLFQVMIVLQNNPSGGWDLPKLSVEAILLDQSVAKFDLTLGLVKDGDELLALFEYNTDLFEEKTIARMADDYIRLLDELPKNHDRPMHGISMMSASEKQKWLVNWNATELKYFPATGNFHGLFEDQARQTPDVLAAVFEGESLTYAELNVRANRLARYLRDQGVRNDSIVALCMDRSLDMLVAIFGVLKAGGAYLPLDPDYPHKRLAFILEDAAPSILIIKGDFENPLPSQLMPEDILVVDLDQQPSELALYSEYNLECCVRPDNLVYVIYTSGSTGNPKGVLLTHRSVVNLAMSHIHGVHRQCKSGQLQTSLNTPYVFDASVSELILLLDGHTLHIIPEDTRLSPEEMLNFCAKHKLDALDSTPAQLKYLIEDGGAERLPPIVMFGGEAIDAALWGEMKKIKTSRFYNAYGPTECTVDVALACVNDSGDRPVIGRPQAGSQLYVLDNDLNPMPQGVIGELHVAGVSLARGYLNQSAMTAEKFIPNPFGESPGERMYKTGDLVRLLSNGELEYISRVDDQVKIRGFRVETGEIESALLTSPSVKQTLVMPTEQNGSTVLVAYIVKNTCYKPLPFSVGDLWSVSLSACEGLPTGINSLHEVNISGQKMLVASSSNPVSLQGGLQQNTYNLMTLAAMPYMRSTFDLLHTGVWPEYFSGSPILKSHWDKIYRYFPQAQMLMMESLSSVVGVGNSVLLSWDGTNNDLPKGWDGALMRSISEFESGKRANTLVVMAGIIDRKFKARKLAGLIVDAFKSLASSLQLEHLIVALRPIAKTGYQSMSIDEYSVLRNDSGELSDAWLRLHCDAGGLVIACEKHSQYVEGTLDEWASWTGQQFGDSGEHFINDTLAEINVDKLSDKAFYYDPCIWIKHPIDCGTVVPVPQIVDLATVLNRQNTTAVTSLVFVNQVPERIDDRSAWAQLLLGLARLELSGGDTESMRKHLGELLPPYMVPAHFVFLDRLPLTNTGKVDRKMLPAPDMSGSALDNYAAPSNKTETILCEVWRDVLSLDRVGVTDNFFEIGGDSILSIRAIARAKPQGIAFTAKQLFANQTIRELSRQVQTTTSLVISQELVEGDLPLLPIQKEFFLERASNHFNQSVLLRVPQKLEIQALRNMVMALLLRHDALRLNFQNNRRQEDKKDWRGWHGVFEDKLVDRSLAYVNIDATSIQDSIFQKHEKVIQASLSLTDGPLFKAVLFEFSGGDKKLLLVLHHLLVDGVSWRVLIKDLEQGYKQYEIGKEAIVLENKTSSCQSWVRFLNNYANSNALQREHSFWLETLQAPVDTLPLADKWVADESMAATDTAQIYLDKEETQALVSRCHHAHATQINDLLLAGVMLGLNHWAGTKQIRITLEGHGREELSSDIDLTETVGWFTSAYPVWLEISDTQNIGQVIQQVKERLRAVPAKGIGYGVLKHLAAKEFRISENTDEPVVVFNYLGQFGEGTQVGENDWTMVEGFKGNTISTEHPRNSLFGINGAIKQGCLTMSLDYNRYRFDASSMELLCRNIETGMRAIIQHCLESLAVIGGGKDLSNRELIFGDAPLMPNAYDFFKRHDLNHWNASDLFSLSAHTNTELMKAALTHTLAQHDGMRRVLVAGDNGWRQRFLLPYQMQPWWQEVDLSQLDTSFIKVEIERRCDEAQKSLDIEKIMFRAIYFNLGPKRDGRLILVIHHFLIDRFGGDIFMEDLEYAYLALESGQEPKFPDKTASFKALSEIWQDRAQHPEVEADLCYWKSIDWERFKPLPTETQQEDLFPVGTEASLYSVIDSLSEEETAFVLSSAERWNDFDLADIVNCAMIYAYGNWSGSRAVCILGGHNGRSLDFDDNVDLSRTVGWCMNYTRTPIDLCDSDSALSAIRSAKRQCSELSGREPHYGLLRYAHPDNSIRAEMEAIPDGQLVFAFIPLHVSREIDVPKSSIFSPADEFAGSNEGPMEPGFRPFGISAVSEDKLLVRWSYCRSAYTERTMKHFAADILAQIMNICVELETCIVDEKKVQIIEKMEN